LSQTPSSTRQRSSGNWLRQFYPHELVHTSWARAAHGFRLGSGGAIGRVSVKKRKEVTPWTTKTRGNTRR